MADQDQGNREHSRRHDHQGNERHKEPFNDENEDNEEILLKDIKKCHKDKNFQKVMEILLNEEKEKYFLKLAQEGAKLPHHFNVETIIMPEEETKMSKH